MKRKYILMNEIKKNKGQKLKSLSKRRMQKMKIVQNKRNREYITTHKYYKYYETK